MSGTMYDKLDRPRKFRLDIAASMAVENVLDCGFHEAMEKHSGPRFFVTVLWAGLNREDRSLSLNDVRKIVQSSINKKRLTMVELQKFLLEQIKQSDAFTGVDWGDVDPDEDEGPSSKKAGRSSSETD